VAALLWSLARILHGVGWASRVSEQRLGDGIRAFVREIDKANRAALGALRVDSLAPGVAQLAAPFDEVVVDTAGREAKFSGYFTGVAVRADSGWTLRNAHWSIVHPASP
jgi:hypothetical protein